MNDDLYYEGDEAIIERLIDAVRELRFVVYTHDSRLQELELQLERFGNRSREWDRVAAWNTPLR